MYLTTAYNRVVALEPETAKEIWVYEVKDGAPAVRGLEFWAGDKDSPATIFFGTSSGKLFALNAQTGKPIPGFGNEGVVDMKPGALNGLENASFGLSSPPIVYKNVVITGAHVQEGPSVGAAGDTRAWDARTGKLIWQFHAVPRPGEVGADTWEKDDWKNRSGTNVWGLFTIDAERGILYQPFGEPTTDYWGGDRKGANLFGTTLVAVDALTGKRIWHYQVVHHDTWDYDLAAPPILFDVTRKGKKIPAVAELTKTGAVFILNRVTGEPIYGVEERKVPVDDALPGDSAWPTQPFPLKPPILARNSFKREDLATVTEDHAKFCQELFDSIPGGLHAGGPFYHYSTTPSVIFPSSIGGGNYNPPSFDPKLGYLFVNTMDFGSLNQMVKNARRYLQPPGISEATTASGIRRPTCRATSRHGAASVRDQREYRRDRMAEHIGNHRKPGRRQTEDRTPEYRRIGCHGRRTGLHRRHRRQPLPRIRFQDRQRVVGDNHRCRRACRPHDVPGKERKTVRRDYSDGGRLPGGQEPGGHRDCVCAAIRGIRLRPLMVAAGREFGASLVPIERAAAAGRAREGQDGEVVRGMP